MRLFRRDHGADASDRWIVVGLGNPGPRYEKTRHNVGIKVLEELVTDMGGALKSHKSGCLVSEGSLEGRRVVLARPTSYMNESGRPVGQLVRFYKTPPEQIVVVHDEIDIPFNDLRVKVGGGTAGHNGVKSIANHLGSKEFIRVRVGVGRPRDDAADHVLSEFSGAERKDLPDLIRRAADATQRILEVGAERAMNEVNTRA